MDKKCAQLWQRLSAALKPQISADSFKRWFSAVELIEAKEKTLTLAVPNNIYQLWIESNYMPALQTAIVTTLGNPRSVKFSSLSGPDALTAEDSAPLKEVLLEPPGDAKPGATVPGLNPRNTFESFVVGPNNEIAHAASLAVAQAPARTYNPLFIYGGVGLGKTHLMQAIGHSLKRRDPSLRLTYVSAEKFTNEVISSIRFERMAAFRERFRNMDVLMIDDIQFIATRERTQEEFFHTFNALYDQQKQIVISSDCPPKEISSIEERLRSRFEWGLIADIQAPDLETKIAILQKKGENEHVQIPDDVAEYIARAIKSNIRELEGALIRLMAYASLTGAHIDLVTAQQVLKNLIDTQEKKVTIEQIQKRVGEVYGIRAQDLKVRSNSRVIAFPRQVAMFLVKQLTSASLPEIGRQFGGKHHTTVLHSIHKIANQRQTDKELNKTINRLLDSFG